MRFEDFFEGGALGWAEDYAVPTGVVDECRKRGLEGLLQVRAMRLVVGMTMSLIYSQVAQKVARDGTAVVMPRVRG